MPRASDAHRAARRERIAEAALRVLARNGSETSIAQIVAECGLSGAATDGTFENKAELAATSRVGCCTPASAPSTTR